MKKKKNIYATPRIDNLDRGHVFLARCRIDKYGRQQGLLGLFRSIYHTDNLLPFFSDVLRVLRPPLLGRNSLVARFHLSSTRFCVVLWQFAAECFGHCPLGVSLCGHSLLAKRKSVVGGCALNDIIIPSRKNFLDWRKTNSLCLRPPGASWSPEARQPRGHRVMIGGRLHEQRSDWTAWAFNVHAAC
ncbi:hypothetical protein MRX96_016250 [Rhipicephalus microplus]